MKRNQEAFSTPRSALGFAVALTFAVGTMWVTGRLVDAQPNTATASTQAAAIHTSVACAPGAAACATSQPGSQRSM